MCGIIITCHCGQYEVLLLRVISIMGNRRLPSLCSCSCTELPYVLSDVGSVFTVDQISSRIKVKASVYLCFKQMWYQRY